MLCENLYSIVFMPILMKMRTHQAYWPHQYTSRDMDVTETNDGHQCHECHSHWSSVRLKSGQTLMQVVYTVNDN